MSVYNSNIYPRDAPKFVIKKFLTDQNCSVRLKVA